MGFDSFSRRDKTSNNQKVTLEDLIITWIIAATDANVSFFKVGGLGNEGISENFVHVVRDWTRRVLGHCTSTDINSMKEQIAKKIFAEAGPAMHEVFGVTLESVQFPKVTYDPAFETSVAAAVAAQNPALQAKAQLNVIPG